MASSPLPLSRPAHEEVSSALRGLGHEVLMLDAEATRYGAVETPLEGEVYANFLRQHRREFDGVIVSLPNFGDRDRGRGHAARGGRADHDPGVP